MNVKQNGTTGSNYQSHRPDFFIYGSVCKQAFPAGKHTQHKQSGRLENAPFFPVPEKYSHLPIREITIKRFSTSNDFRCTTPNARNNSTKADRLILYPDVVTPATDKTIRKAETSI